MNIASIDIGSNTVLLLIAGIEENSKNIHTILNLYEIPRISRNLEKNGNISDAAIKRLFNVIKSYDKIIKEYHCKHILVNATNAFRISSNASEIVKSIKDIFGYNANILPGSDEAYLSYLGATYGKNESIKMVIDIGGGSTEIIIGQGETIEFAESIGIGAVNLTEKYCSSLPPTFQEITNIRMKVREHLSRLKIDNKFFNASDAKMIAVAGTPTTLSCISQNLQEYDEDSVEGSVLTFNNLDTILNELTRLSPNEIRQKYGEIVKGREDILPAGTIALKTIAEFFEIKDIIVSGRGIRYGAVLNFLISSD